MKSRRDMTKMAEAVDSGKALESFPLFADLRPSELSALWHIAATKEYRKGQLIFSEGEASRNVCLVNAGVVKIFCVNADGRETMLQMAKAGEPFAVEALFRGSHTASAQALVPQTTVIRLEGNGFKRLLLRSPQLSLKMIEMLACRLSRMADYRRKGVSARFASYLLSLPAERDGGIELPVSKTIIAEMLGTTKETLSRSLRRLADGRILTRRGNQLQILNRYRLDKIASGDVKLRIESC